MRIERLNFLAEVDMHRGVGQDIIAAEAEPDVSDTPCDAVLASGLIDHLSKAGLFLDCATRI